MLRCSDFPRASSTGSTFRRRQSSPLSFRIFASFDVVVSHLRLSHRCQHSIENARSKQVNKIIQRWIQSGDSSVVVYVTYIQCEWSVTMTETTHIKSEFMREDNYIHVRFNMKLQICHVEGIIMRMLKMHVIPRERTSVARRKMFSFLPRHLCIPYLCHQLSLQLCTMTSKWTMIIKFTYSMLLGWRVLSQTVTFCVASASRRSQRWIKLSCGKLQGSLQLNYQQTKKQRSSLLSYSFACSWWGDVICVHYHASFFDVDKYDYFHSIVALSCEGKPLTVLWSKWRIPHTEQESICIIKMSQGKTVPWKKSLEESFKSVQDIQPISRRTFIVWCQSTRATNSTTMRYVMEA